MRASHDEDRSKPKDMYSLGVVDLDLSLSPDAFGLRAFDSGKPIVPDSSNNSVTAVMGSSREETFTRSEVVVIVPPVGDVRPVQMDAELLAGSPLPIAEGLLQDLLWASIAPRPPRISDHGDPCLSAKVPR